MRFKQISDWAITALGKALAESATAAAARSQLGTAAAEVTFYEFATTTTQLLPTNWLSIRRAVLHGGGAGGVGGGRQPVGITASGCTGGNGPGAIDSMFISRAQCEAIYGAPVTHIRATVGAGGNGGAGATTNNATGANAGSGGTTILEIGDGSTWVTLFNVIGGNGGSGVNASGAQTLSFFTTSQGGAGSNNSNGGNSQGSPFCGGGGGGGAGKGTGGSAGSGGLGGSGGRLARASLGNNSFAPQNTDGAIGINFMGGGGGGGGAGTAADGVSGNNGGAGGFPGGGGGGGGAGAGSGNGGSGGSGASGVVYLWVGVA